jgi:hypothetical protein
MRGLSLVVALALVIGCAEKGPNTDTATDVGAINVLLVDIVDASNNPGLAEKVFDKASMPKPADRMKYRDNMYRAIPEEIVIEGTSAKMKVEILDSTGAVKATKDWTATKADGTWKLQAAPL